MNITITPSRVGGKLHIPASKSQTIRALLIASAARGTSIIENPLDSQDTRSCVSACTALGARIHTAPGVWTVEGSDLLQPSNDHGQPLVIDTGNSGTTLYLAIGLAAAAGRKVIFTGDEQIRSRPVKALLEAYRQLGVRLSWDIPAEYCSDRRLKEGSAPFMIEGPISGGDVSIECPTSQYLSSLLLAAPLAEHETSIFVPLLNERPYAEMTLQWLDEQGIDYTKKESPLLNFRIRGNQTYRSFTKEIAGDFSSASFFFSAAAVTNSSLLLTGLDRNDTQGDKDVLHCLEQLGCSVTWEDEGVRIEKPEGPLTGGCTFDLNPIPDALPVLSVVSCFAVGTTRLVNVPQARIKETDRIAVMRQELTKLGADIEELEDGLVIHGTGRLEGGTVSGHGDHRVIMACAVAGLASDQTVTIEGAEAVNITCPDFFNMLTQAGGEYVQY
jgi:3-phosphoshikimate 1-carboxyvinyltransferase